MLKVNGGRLRRRALRVSSWACLRFRCDKQRVNQPRIFAPGLLQLASALCVLRWDIPGAQLSLGTGHRRDPKFPCINDLLQPGSFRANVIRLDVVALNHVIGLDKVAVSSLGCEHEQVTSQRQSLTSRISAHAWRPRSLGLTGRNANLCFRAATLQALLSTAGLTPSFFNRAFRDSMHNRRQQMTAVRPRATTLELRGLYIFQGSSQAFHLHSHGASNSRQVMG